MAEYRWNQKETAAGYDAGAPLVHPYYVEVQDAVIAAVSAALTPQLIVDCGGGSGRLLERCLEQWPGASALLIDQSVPFLEIAQQRLERFGERVAFQQARLQDDWSHLLPASPHAIISTSAVHHLLPDEKRDFYARCASALAPGGVLVNGDEVRDPDEAVYRASVEKWAAHMQQLAADGRVSAAMADALLKWRARNVDKFGEVRNSGDDCHETIDIQLEYFRAAGLTDVRVGWQQDMWAVMIGHKPA